MFRKLLLISFVAIFLDASSLRVAVAANVSFVINDLISSFHKRYPDIKVETILGSSGKLNAQIKRGAPFDIFMAANMKYPKDLFDKGLALEPPKVYAQGILALFGVKRRDFSKGIEIVKERTISRVAIANPDTAPYGKAAVEALKSAKLYASIKDKLIYAQSISQTVQYTLTATDLGFITKSSLFSPKMRGYKEGKNWIDIDRSLYAPILQGVIIIKSSKNQKIAKEFYNFIFSKEAKKLFRKYGYI